MNCEFLIPTNMETRAAVDQLREALNALARTEPAGQFNEDWVCLQTSSRPSSHRRRAAELINVLLRFDEACPQAVLQAIWPWLQYLHTLSAMPACVAPLDWRRATQVTPLGGQRPVSALSETRSNIGTAAGQVRWDDEQSWHTSHGTTRISEMESSWLWTTLNWCIQQTVPCWTAAGSPGGKHRAAALAAPRWLSEQPAFRALAQEAVRRGLTFTDETFLWLQRFLAGVTAEIIPWQDPQRAAQAGQLAGILKLPTTPGPHRTRRRIEIDATSNALGADQQ